MDYLEVNDLYPDAGDHAANWETSHMLASHPKPSTCRYFPQRSAAHRGDRTVLPQDATAVRSAPGPSRLPADRIVRETLDRLDHPERYRAHGKALARTPMASGLIFLTDIARGSC